MTIRERMQELTADAHTQVDLDRLCKPTLATIRAEFPNVSVSEIMYEWDSIKMSIHHEVDGDDY